MTMIREKKWHNQKPAGLKLFIPLYGALMALVVTVALIVYLYETSGGRELIELSERLRLEGLEREIALNIQSVISDMLVLAEDDEFLEILHEDSRSAMRTLTEDFRSFVERKRVYDHIRYLDTRGMERIRVNRGDEKAVVVPSQNLQDKGDRYYFLSMKNLKNGQVYMSPLDLNVEQGKIEEPHKPMIRFGTAIRDRNQNPGGFLVLNYLAGGFLERISSGSAAGLTQTYLLNGDGYILQGPDPDYRWGFMFEQGKSWTFATEFEGVWAKMRAEGGGQLVDGGDLYTFQTVELPSGDQRGPELIREPEKGNWMIVSRISKESIYAGFSHIRMWLGLMVGVLAIALAGVCWLLVVVRLKNLHAEDRIRKSLLEKEALLREIHHRVKNNLQVISGMLELQAASVKDPSARSSLQDGRNRVMSMALIHQKLYQSEDIAQVRMDSYLESLVTDLFTAFGADTEIVRMKIEADAVPLNLDTAIPFGLLVSELVTNALKYAFPLDEPLSGGEVKVVFREGENGKFVLVVSDNGAGLPGDFDPGQATSLGLKLVHTMVEQLGGEISREGPPGTAWTIICPPYQGAEGVVE